VPRGTFEVLETSKVLYCAGSTRIALRQQITTTSVVSYLHGDHLGSTSLATSLTGTVIARQTYTPYGEPRGGATGTLPTDYRFTGQRSEEATLGSLYDFNARFMSPVLGRFISADSIVPRPGDPQSLNRYAYVRNNPTGRTDPTGHADDDGVPDPGMASGGGGGGVGVGIIIANMLKAWWGQTQAAWTAFGQSLSASASSEWVAFQNGAGMTVDKYVEKFVGNPAAPPLNGEQIRSLSRAQQIMRRPLGITGGRGADAAYKALKDQAAARVECLDFYLGDVKIGGSTLGQKLAAKTYGLQSPVQAKYSKLGDVDLSIPYLHGVDTEFGWKMYQAVPDRIKTLMGQAFGVDVQSGHLHLSAMVHGNTARLGILQGHGLLTFHMGSYRWASVIWPLMACQLRAVRCRPFCFDERATAFAKIAC
jgi:RHS repeat-associated protein